MIHRDLSVNPVPHISVDAHTAGFADPATHTPAQAAAFAERVRLIEELEQADAVLIGAPMYNATIPSTLKAWLDNVILMGRTAGTEDSKLKGIPAVVIASRGGAYGPGTPREGYDYVQNYLKAILVDALGLDVEFIVPELTMAPAEPCDGRPGPALRSVPRARPRRRGHQGKGTGRTPRRLTWRPAPHPSSASGKDIV